ncbi:MAG: outer membrane beta-barrel protein [Oceanipulchritudo sp.]
MNKHLPLVLATAAVAAPAYGLVNLGEGRIDFDMSVSSFYDTEIRARDAGEEDFIFSARPSLVYNRPSRLFDFSASVGLDFQKYLDYDEYDETNVFFDLNISPNARRETSRFVFSGDLLFNTETRSDETVGEIINVLNYGASAEVIYDPNRKFTIIGNTSYRREDPDSDVYDKVDNFELSGTLQVPVKEDVYIQGLVGYLDTSSDGRTTDSQTITYAAGFDGKLLPKLTGSFLIGMQDRDYDSREDDSSPYGSAGLDWAIDERSNINLIASQSVGTTIDDRSSETLDIRLTASRKLTRDLSGSLFAGYSDTSYDALVATDTGITTETRDDEEYSVGGRISYQLVRWGSVSFEARYLDRSSSEPLFDYDRLRIGVTLNGRW